MTRVAFILSLLLGTASARADVPPPDDIDDPATHPTPTTQRPTPNMGAPIDANEELPYLAPRPKDIVIESPGERTAKNIAICSGILVGGLAFGGLGLHYNLDARDASDKVSASVVRDPATGNVVPTGKTWTADDQKLVDQASSSSTKAEIFYAVGGAAVIGAVVYFILTDPPTQRSVIHTTRPEQRRVVPTITPTTNGTFLGATGRF